ncbi:MAG: hypothetical protein WDM76_06725 [Limisphaerales bacterium]
MRAILIWSFQRFLFLGCFLGMTTVLSAETYTPPAAHRTDTILDSNWRFIREDVSGAQAKDFNDSVWSSVNLPHTWNNLDGQDGGNDYHRGIGWYRTHLKIGKGDKGRQFFLKLMAHLWWPMFGLTEIIWANIGADSRRLFLMRRRSFASARTCYRRQSGQFQQPDVPPLSADFTFFGGLYRDVHLLVTDPIQISPLDCGRLSQNDRSQF